MHPYPINDYDVCPSDVVSYAGSTIVYPYNDTSLPELELGASIFVDANRNLWRASEEFNLTRRDFNDQDSETGIWDGENLLFSVTKTTSSFDLHYLTTSYSFLDPGGIWQNSYGGMDSYHPDELNQCERHLLIYHEYLD